MSKPLVKIIDTRKEENVIQGGFAVDKELAQYMDEGFKMPNKTQECPFMKVDKSTVTLDNLMKTLSTHLGLPFGGSDMYGLMYEKSISRNSETFNKSYIFVTEESLLTLKDRFLLIVCASPKMYAKKMFSKLSNFDVYGKWETTMDILFELSQDISFVKEFHKLNGIHLLVKMIQDGVFDSNVKLLCTILDIFMVLMKHSNIYEYNSLPTSFVIKILECVNGYSKFEDNNLLRLSLTLILTILDKASNLEELVKNKIGFESLIRHLEKTEDTILHPLLTLMNYLYENADKESKLSILKAIHSKPFCKAIYNIIYNILNKPDDRIYEQLMLIQEIMYQTVRDLALRRPTRTEIERITEMSEWNSYSPRSSNTSFEDNLSYDRKSLSSLKGMAPNAKTCFYDFVSLTPPGSLVLDTILAYVTEYGKILSELQAECNFPLESWPIILARLIDVLAKALFVDKSDAEEFIIEISPKLLLLVFASDNFFINFFVLTMELFIKTWREMHATPEDEDKVLNVIKNQLALGISKNLSSFDELKNYLYRDLSYFHIQKIFDQQRNEKEELKLKTNTINDLRKYLKPEMELLVRARKIQALKNGYAFNKLVKGKTKTNINQIWYWRLNETEQLFNYSDRDENINNMSRLGSRTLPIVYIKRIITGSEFSEILAQQIGIKWSKKTSKVPLQSGFAFQLKGNNEEYMTLLVDDEHILRSWIEGINILLGDYDQQSFDAEVTRLLDMEVRIRLLNVTNLSPDPPPISSLPDNFDWIPEKHQKAMEKKILRESRSTNI